MPRSRQYPEALKPIYGLQRSPSFCCRSLLSSDHPNLVVYSRSLRTAGNHMDESIMNYVKRKYNLLIGERMAERIKIEIGSASALEKPVTMEVKGRSLIEGIPKTITVDDSEIREAFNECVVVV